MAWEKERERWHPIKSVVMQYICVFIYLFFSLYRELVKRFPEVTDIYLVTKPHKVQQLFALLFLFIRRTIFLLSTFETTWNGKEEKEHLSARSTPVSLSLPLLLFSTVAHWQTDAELWNWQSVNTNKSVVECMVQFVDGCNARGVKSELVEQITWTNLWRFSYSRLSSRLASSFCRARKNFALEQLWFENVSALIFAGAARRFSVCSIPHFFVVHFTSHGWFNKTKWH